jgi:hypothetical protein
LYASLANVSYKWDKVFVKQVKKTNAQTKMENNYLALLIGFSLNASS